MPRWLAALPLVVAVGCVDTLNQTAGIAAAYSTRCSAVMEVKENEYFAQCTPESCIDGFRAAPTSHVLVAVDPGRKVFGYAERVCIQDLSNASALFPPQVPEEPLEPSTEDGAEE